MWDLWWETCYHERKPYRIANTINGKIEKRYVYMQTHYTWSYQHWMRPQINVWYFYHRLRGISMSEKKNISQLRHYSSPYIQLNGKHENDFFGRGKKHKYDTGALSHISQSDYWLFVFIHFLSFFEVIFFSSIFVSHLPFSFIYQRFWMEVDFIEFLFTWGRPLRPNIFNVVF